MTGALISSEIHLRHASDVPLERSSFLRTASGPSSPSPFFPGCAVLARSVSADRVFSSPFMGTLSSCGGVDGHASSSPRMNGRKLEMAASAGVLSDFPGSQCLQAGIETGPQEQPATVHQYKRSGSFGATCDLCRIGTEWDSAERRDPGPCMGAR